MSEQKEISPQGTTSQEMSSQKKKKYTKQTYKRLVYIIRCLYQNQEITEKCKDELITYVYEGVMKGSYPPNLRDELNYLARSSRFCVEIKKVLTELS